MPPDGNISISVFFPAYNDEASIGKLVERAYDVLKAVASDFEIIVVNDGSSDNTAAVLAELENSMPSVRVVTHEVNGGYGAALRSGFAAATKDLVFYTDGDGQYDVGQLKLLLEALKDDLDVVNGFKLNRADGLHRKVLGKTYGWTVRKLFSLPIRDVDCDFRLIRRTAMGSFELSSSSGAICVELVKQLDTHGARFAEVGVDHFPRQTGRSQFLRPRRVGKTLFDLFGLWTRLVFRKRRKGERDGS